MENNITNKQNEFIVLLGGQGVLEISDDLLIPKELKGRSTVIYKIDDNVVRIERKRNKLKYYFNDDIVSKIDLIERIGPFLRNFKKPTNLMVWNRFLTDENLQLLKDTNFKNINYNGL